MEQDQNQKVEKVLTISKKKFLWTIFIVLVIAAIVLFVFVRSMSTARLGSAGMANSPVASSARGREAAYPPQYFNQGNGTISDMREFMKVYYDGQIKTHDVRDTMRDVRSIVRDADGRIDSETVNDRYGSIRFVIEKKNFEEFQDDMAASFNTKLYTESTTSENLLSEKQSIEERTDQARTALTTVKDEQAALKKAHTARVASLNTRIGAVQKSLSSIRINLSNTTPSSEEHNTLVQSENTLIAEENTLRSQLQSQNSDYSNKNSALADQVTMYEDTLKGLDNDEEEFADKVETVEGTVTAQFTSWWGIFKEFSPVHPTIIVIILALVLFRVLQRIRVLPIIRFV